MAKGEKPEDHEEHEIDLTTVGGRIDNAGMGFYTWKMLFVVGIYGYGFVPAWWVCQPVFLNPKMQADWGAETWEMGLPSSFQFLGWAIGAVVGTNFADGHGRKKALFVALLGSCLSSLLSLVAVNIVIYIIVRMLLGAFCGAFGAIGYILAAEYLPSSQRGPMTIVMNVFFSVGIIVLTLFGYMLRDAS